MGDWSASTRYRAMQYVPRLEPMFESVEVSLPADVITRRPGRRGQMHFFAEHALRYGKRALELKRLTERSDTLFVQRGLYALGPELIVRALDRFSGRLVFDLDDAVFSVSPVLAQKSHAARWLYGPQQALALLRRADAVVVSTEILAEMLPRDVSTPTVLPTIPDPAAYRPVRHERTNRVVIGWAGTAVRYLDPLANVFARLHADGTGVLEVVASHPWHGPGRFRRWRMEDEASLFNRFDIGVMPLPDTPYTRAKAGFKLLQYMAAGLPVVSSPVGVNRELVERSQSGFLAATDAEWEASIRTLAGDPACRAELGANGRRFVERFADLDEHARVLGGLIGGR